MKSSGIRLLSKVLCAHCRHRFEMNQILSIARHPDLVGDPIVGKDANLRFLASRFNALGHAIDPKDTECSEFACPRCHLEIPPAALEVEPLFASIVGSASSGKSYFLATMTWHLRSLLPRFGWSMTDADPLANQLITQSEKSLFQSRDGSQLVRLEKTKLSGEGIYRTVTINSATVTLPQPFQFVLRPIGSKELSRLIVLYDNAGEHFNPDRRHEAASITEHLAHSRVLLFLLDPTQDPRLRRLCKTSDPQIQEAEIVRQDVLLSEMDQRIRRHNGTDAKTPSKLPLIVVLSKADLLSDHFEGMLTQEPLHITASGKAQLNLSTVLKCSNLCRNLLLQHMPEFVAAAEQISAHTLYIPASALGGSPERKDESTKDLFVRPDNLKPSWVTVPFLCALQHLSPDEFPAVLKPEGGSR